MTDALKDLPDAEYNGIRFPVERAEWQGGNDLVEHTAYRRPGADIEPTGRKPYRGSFVIPLINTPALVARYGQLFPGLRYDLVTAFEDRPIATLWHPTLGQLVAAIGDVSETASAEDRGGVRLTVQWVEHDASVALARGPDSPAPDAAQQGVTQRAERADVANANMERALRVVYDVEREISRYLLTVTVINGGLGLAVAGGGQGVSQDGSGGRFKTIEACASRP